MTYPPEDLACPDPARCPILAPAELPKGLTAVHFSAGTPLYRVHDGTWGFDEPNPGFGDARFSPFDALDHGHQRVPTLYLAENPSAALLETVFHDVHQSADRLIYEDTLRRALLVHLRIPWPLRLVDLRDAALEAHGIERAQLAASSAEHYPCTRRIAKVLHGRDVASAPVQGLVWHSRQAELGGSQASTLVVFTDRYPAGRGDWVRIGPGSQNLYEGPGRLQIDQLALQLDATIVS